MLASGSVPKPLDASTENLGSPCSAAQLLGQLLHNLPQLCSLFCVATGREFQALVHTRTNLPPCCLAAGRGVSLWARGNGGVFASKRAWPRPGWEPQPSPAWCRLLPLNRSFLGSPGPRPGHRGGSSGDILDTVLEQQAWPGAPRSRGRWCTLAVQPGMWGLHPPEGRAVFSLALG